MAALMLSQLKNYIDQVLASEGDMPVASYSFEACEVMEIEDSTPQVTAFPKPGSPRPLFKIDNDSPNCPLFCVAHVEYQRGRNPVLTFMIPNVG